MDEYRIHIESFEGPLDLLLHLVRKNEYEIFDIPMAQITRQYLDFLDLMKELNIDIAGEYLVMAATLAKIKSAMLLPRPEIEDGEQGPDPREELARQLLEYARYREAAAEIGDRPMLGRDVFARKFPSPDLEEARQTPGYLEVQMSELLDAFREVLKRVPLDQRIHYIAPDRWSIRERMTQLTELLAAKGSVIFEQLFDEKTTKSEMITTFLALLELMKLRLVRVFQESRLASIHIVARVRTAEVGATTDEAANEAATSVSEAPAAGETSGGVAGDDDGQ
ncbi:MAG: segregation/condensation protein A [Deltaproteobacteria bacterium]|nr:segregation/condensation protein A [Deltaproteobacteria bacterium]